MRRDPAREDLGHILTGMGTGIAKPRGRLVRFSVADPAGHIVRPHEPIENNDARAPFLIVVEAECEFGWHEIGRVPLPLFPPRGEWAARDPDA